MNKKRINIIFIMFILISVFLVYRLSKFCISASYGGKELKTIASSQYAYREKLSDINFQLLDRNGKNLLVFSHKYYAVMDPKAFYLNDFTNKNVDLYTVIALLKNYDPSYNLLQSKENSLRQSYIIDEDTYNKLKNIKTIKGFYTYAYEEVNKTEANRIENILVTFNKSSGGSKDNESLESRIKEAAKDNSYPYVSYDKDLNNYITGSSVLLPKDNKNVILTLDRDIQDSVRSVLTKDKSHNVAAVLTEVSTGKILALCQGHEDKPNEVIGQGMQGYQPASIFKIIVLEQGISSGAIKKNDLFTCTGETDKGITTHHGTLTAGEALMVSCNSIFERIGKKDTYDGFISLAKAEGLYKKVLYLDGEAPGMIELPRLGEDREKSFSIGHKMAITPLQAINIINTVVNEGKYVKPYLLLGYGKDKDSMIKVADVPANQVIDKDTANYVKEQLLDTVKNGTGRKAKIDGIEIGGKTGTSERIENGYHSDGWFLGFFNIKGKYYSLVVLVPDLAKGDETGGYVAAPIFKEIVEKVKDLV